MRTIEADSSQKSFITVIYPKLKGQVIPGIIWWMQRRVSSLWNPREGTNCSHLSFRTDFSMLRSFLWLGIIITVLCPHPQQCESKSLIQEPLERWKSEVTWLAASEFSTLCSDDNGKRQWTTTLKLLEETIQDSIWCVLHIRWQFRDKPAVKSSLFLGGS